MSRPVRAQPISRNLRASLAGVNRPARASAKKSGPFGSDNICAVIAETTASAAIRQTRDALAQTHLLEIRLDDFAAPWESFRFLEWLRREKRKSTSAVCAATFIATCRRREAKGRFRGSIAEQLAWIALAVNCGCQWADVEIETSRKLPQGAISRWIAPAKWIVSAHDFSDTHGKTASSAAGTLALLHAQGADIAKIALPARTLHEALDVIALGRARFRADRRTTRSAAGSANRAVDGLGGRRTVAIPMGEISLPARMLALREGSPLVYSAARAMTAPGQPTLLEALHLYHADKITRKTRIYGVLGDPIAHSLSPALHNAAFQALEMDAVLLPFLTPAPAVFPTNSLCDFIRCIPRMGIRGFAVTLPHKETIMRYLDECDFLAAEIGAVNTVVVRRDGKLAGFNTDYFGILRALERQITLGGSRVLILGAGGTARTAAYALTREGAEVSICARRPERTRRLARLVNGEALPRRALRHESFDVIVNATPVGMFPKTASSPLRGEELRCGLVVDAVYRPMQTRLLELAKAQGIKCVPGMEMFLAQGEAQFKIWTGKPAPEAAMRKAVLAALRETRRSA